MSLGYRLAYRIGFTPWDRGPAPSAAPDQLLRLVAREETGEKPYGRALDVGCGRGPNSIRLAERGWQVTGVDAVPRAIQQARERAAAAGVSVDFVRADATRMSAAIGRGYRLLLDIGCFHGLDEEQQEMVVREETAVTEPGAVLILLAFQPGRRGPLPDGVSREDLVREYAGWTLTDQEPAEVSQAPRIVQHAAPQYYRLVRR